MPPEPARAPYYLDGFERMLDTVVDRYGDLLTAGETAFARDLGALSVGARCLYARLLSRVGPYFRRDDLRYDEILDLDGTIDELSIRGFLDAAPRVDPRFLLPHLLRREIETTARLLGIALARGASKPRWIESLLSAASAGAPPAETLRAAVLDRVRLVAPLRLEHVALYRLLFFGNLRQDESSLTLAELGVWRYESYPLRRDLRLFGTRAAIEDALEIRRLGNRAREHLAAGDLRGAWEVAANVARREAPWDAGVSPLADAILIEVARALERTGEPAAREAAIELYAASRAPPARERRARLLERAGRERAAIAVCREIAAEPRDESERLFAASFEQHVRRRLGQVPPLRRRYRTARRLALRPDPGRAVEEMALEHYASVGRPGFHGENWLWHTLFGLAFWDVVFAPVPGAFQHAFQDGPLDLYASTFRDRRAGAIEARLAEIAAHEWPAARLLAVWESKLGVRNRLVAWWPSAPGHLELALSRLRGQDLAAVLDRLSRDLRRYGRGLPDLFLATAGEPGFELLEVKSPGDRLRPEQIGWLDYLSDRGLPCAVLAVEWTTTTASPRAAYDALR